MQRLARVVALVALVCSALTAPTPAGADHSPTHSGPLSIADAGIKDLASSPGFATDNTIFALGSYFSGTAWTNVLFKTTDAGATWSALPTVGLADGSAILLPPAYPTDSRIFVSSLAGLFVSYDGGATFVLAAAVPVDRAEISPGFNSGDPRIVLVGARLAYNGSTGLTEPMLPAYPSAYHFANFTFPPDYMTTGEAFVVGYEAGALGVNNTSSVYSCVTGALVCTQRWDAGVTHVGVRTLDYSPSYATDHTMYLLHKPVAKSTDSGHTFTPITDPEPAGQVQELKWDAAGQMYAAVVNFLDGGVYRSTDGGTTWTELYDASASSGVSDIEVLPGRILTTGFTGIACSTDGGATWAGNC